MYDVKQWQQVYFQTIEYEQSNVIYKNDQENKNDTNFEHTTV